MSEAPVGRGRVRESPMRAAVIAVPSTVPLGSDELERLVQSGAAPGAVVFALTGPREPAGAVCARHRELLAEYAPGYEHCPFVAGPFTVGGPGHEALRAAAARAREYAESEESGPALEAARKDARTAAARRAADRGRAEASRELVRLQRRRADAAARRAELRTADGLPARMTELRTRLARVRMRSGHALAAQARTITARSRERIDAAGRAALRGHPGELRGELSRWGARLGADLDRLLADALPADPPPAGPGGDAALPRVPDGPPARGRTAEDRLMVLMGASGGLGIGRLVAAGPLSGAWAASGAWQAVSWPLTLVLGGLCAWWIVRARAHLGDRARIRRWAAEAVAEYRAGWERHIAARVLDAEAQGLRDAAALHARAVREADAELARTDADIAACRARSRTPPADGAREAPPRGIPLRADA